MQLTVRGAVSTVPITRAFGWESNEAFVQHVRLDKPIFKLILFSNDVQECMNSLFEFLRRECAGSDLSRHIDTHFSGRLVVKTLLLMSRRTGS